MASLRCGQEHCPQLGLQLKCDADNVAEDFLQLLLLVLLLSLKLVEHRLRESADAYIRW